MLRSRILRSVLLPVTLFHVIGLAALTGCSEDESTTLGPDRGGPLNSRGVLPGLPGELAPAGPTPAPIATRLGQWNSIADLNGDGLRDIFIAHPRLHRVKVHIATGDNTFREELPVPVVNPRDVIDCDLNGDGLVDLAVYSPTGRTVSLFTNRGVADFTLAKVRVLPGDATGIVAGDYDENGRSDIFFTTANPVLMYIVLDEASGYGIKSLTQRAFENGVEPQVNAANCGDEPPCNPSPEYPGIQECMRAAECRGDKCLWAACVLYGGGGFWKSLRYAGAVAACAAVLAAEITTCLPSQLIPKIGVSSATLPK